MNLQFGKKRTLKKGVSSDNNGGGDISPIKGISSGINR